MNDSDTNNTAYRAGRYVRQHQTLLFGLALLAGIAAYVNLPAASPPAESYGVVTAHAIACGDRDDMRRFLDLRQKDHPAAMRLALERCARIDNGQEVTIERRGAFDGLYLVRLSGAYRTLWLPGSVVEERRG